MKRHPCRRALAVTGAILALAAMGFAAYLIAPVAAGAAATIGGRSWLAGEADWSDLGGTSAADLGGTWPSWVMCGGVSSEAGACHPGQVRTYENYALLAAALTQHRIPAGAWIATDFEGWKQTPAWQQADPMRYLRLAGQLAHHYGVHIIQAPVPTGPDLSTRAERQAAGIAEVAEAALYSDVVDIQDQAGETDPAAYRAYAITIMTRVRAERAHALIIDGLATDPGGWPVTALQMWNAYLATRGIVAGWWPVAAKWISSTGWHGCASMGCPAAGDAFLSAVRSGVAP